MCGLAGWRGTPDKILIKNMLETLVSRGPDEEGSWSENDVQLGHRRLSVIDLEDSRQPMVSDTSTLVFNGEIYNFPELRKELEKNGCIFNTSGDTEVLKKALDTWGPEALKKTKGMFALAYYRRREKSLLLARDPLGKKPLFYHHRGKELVFASTCRALRRHPRVSAQPQFSQVAFYLFGEAPEDPATIYEDIESLPAGHWLLFQNDRLTIRSFWQWPQENPRLTREEIDEEFSVLFAQSLKRRLISDVPLGIFLSGGIDSSSVLCQAREIETGHSFETFSVAFNEKSYDESPYARLAARSFNAKHHEEILSQNNLIEVLPQALEALDQPLADASLLPFFLLCRMTRKKVTVALSGDGADDLMAGYDPFQALFWQRIFRFLPRNFQAFLLRRLESSSLRGNNLPWNFLVKQFLRGLPFKEFEAGARWMSAFDREYLENFFERSFSFRFAENPQGPKGLLHYFRTRYFKDQILTKVDRASMAHSLEVRSPFCDIDLVNFLASLPFKELFKGKGKLPLRRWARNRLPKTILERKKKGFGMPIAQWLQGPLKEWVVDLVQKPALKELALKPEKIIALRDAHLSGREDHRKELWALCVLLHWYARR
jgi:asparagine synthase (glutamine-hydrolysing)